MNDFQSDTLSALARIEANQLTEKDYRVNHGLRLTALEKWQWKVAGGAVAVSAILSFVIKVFHG